MGVVTLVPLSIPLQLAAPHYDASREAYFRLTGAARDDSDLPLRAPDAARIVRRITRVDASYQPVPGKTNLWVGDFVYRHEAPADDFYLNPDHTIGAEITRVESRPPSQAQWDAYIRRQGPYPTPTAVTVPDLTRNVFAIAPPALDRMWKIDSGLPRPSVPPAFYPTPIRQELAGAWSIESARDHGRAYQRGGNEITRTMAPDDGRFYTFAEPYVRTLYNGLAPGRVVELPPGARVLLEDPHPYLTALPPPAPGTGYVLLQAGFGGEHGNPITRFRVVESRYAIVYDAKRTTLTQTPEGYFILQNETHDSGNFLDKLENTGGVFGQGYRAVARSAAGQLVFLAAVTIATAGAGSAFAASILTGAGNVAGTGVASGLGAPVGASLLPGGNAPAQLGGDAASSAGSAPARVGEFAARNAQEIREGYSQLDTETTDRALAEIAVSTAWLGGFDSFYGELYRFLATAAQSPKLRTQVRLAIATEKAKVSALGGDTLVIARHVWTAVQTLVTAGAVGELERSVQLLLDLVTQLIARAQSLAATYESVRLIEALQLQMLAAHDRALAELLRRIDLGAPDIQWGAVVAGSDPMAEKTGAANLSGESPRPWWVRFLIELARQLGFAAD